MFNQFNKQQKHRLLLVGIATFVAVVGTAHADIVRITSINDLYDANHAAQVFVKPGDVVTFSADLLDDANNFQAEGDTVEDFVWAANDGATDVCDASSQADCLATSNFQVTNYGVSFYVPYTIGQSLVIRVSSRNPRAFENGQRSFDVVTLNNQSYQQGYVPPTTVITSPDQYNQGTFNSEVALAGQGRWVVIGETRYWSPYTYVVDSDDEWQPYQHGYWINSNLGWTWNSYDPWGWATDHYGIWRHHGSYGWVWLPFDDNHYEPHCVTWFHDNDRIGWYPYHDRWEAGYRHGPEYGFNDGYWEGHNVFRGYGDAGYGYHGGFTAVENRHFRDSDIYGSRYRDRNAMPGMFRDSYNRNAFNHELGGFRDHEDSRRFVEGRIGGAVAYEQVNRFRTPGGAELMRHNPVHTVPDGYQQIARNDHFNGRPVPVGSVQNQRPNAGNGRGGFIPPSSNGRGLMAPPRAIDPRTGQSNEMPPHSSRPFAPQPQNPIGGHQPVIQPINHPTPGNVPHPGFNPHQPAPVGQPPHSVPPEHGHPVNPQPVHNNPAPTQPVPVHNNPAPTQPAPVHNNPAPTQPAPVHNNPAPAQPAPVHNNPAPAQPAPVHNNPAPTQPAPVHNNPAPTQPAPAPYHPAPAPYHPAPAPYHPAPSQPAPAPYHPAPAPYHPAPSQPAPAPYHPAPAPYHPAPEPYHPAPAPYHPAPSQPAPVHNNPAPAPFHPAPSPGGGGGGHPGPHH